MKVKLHANARLTPRQRREVQQSPMSVTQLAKQFGVTETTIRRWRGRTSVEDRSHTPHNLHQSTSPVEEELIVSLRQQTRLSLDDITEVMNRCVNRQLSRSAIHRCLHRCNAAKLPDLQDQELVKHGTFELTSCGYIHIDLKYLTRLQKQASYVFVAIDRATRFVYIEIITDRKAKTITACLERFLANFPHPVHTILTDNGGEFTDRFGSQGKGRTEGKVSGQHLFDKLCQAHGIEHRLIKPFHPQTNGMVERFNRRIATAIRNHPAATTNSGKNKFETNEQRNMFLHQFVDNYNKTRLRCLKYQAPNQILYNLTKDNTNAR